MSHSHSQIMALPVVPPTASARIQSMKEHFAQTGKCALCQVRQNDLLIDESNHFISIVPFAATFPFEIWIIPRDHSSHFHELDYDKVISAFLMAVPNCNALGLDYSEVETDDFWFGFCQE